MELTEIKRVLEENLNKTLADGRKRNIVFWYDDAGEFEEEINQLNFTNAKVLKLDRSNSFLVKYTLEHLDQDSNYLIYAPYGQPEPRENYLLDIQKYSDEFSTDKATAIMRELNVTNKALHDAFHKYLKFFNNKERLKTFRSYALSSYSEETLDIAVLSVLCKLPYPDFEEALKVLLVEFAEGESDIYESIDKFGNTTALWHLIGRYYGYTLEQRDLATLSISLLVTGLDFTLQRQLPDEWKPFVTSKQSNVVVFLSHLMGNWETAKSYQLLSHFVGEKIKLQDQMDKWEIDDYQDSDIFPLFDESIIQNLVDNILSDTGEFEKYQEILQGRRTKHWFKEYENEYDAVYWACILLDGVRKQVFKDYPPYDFIKKYADEYCQLDRAYRKFIYSFDRVAFKDWFASLKDKVENTYVNGYLNALSVRWSGCAANLCDEWGVDPIPHQWTFYQDLIKPHLKRGEKVFVIISDGLRYEAAQEFTEMLNSESKGSTEIVPWQGVIPSYTKLGMACLLPYQKIEISPDYAISVNGISVEGTENRSKILKLSVEKSIAVQYKEIIDLKNDDLRKLLNGKNLIYIYHNSIDARGDHYPTEREVFDAVEETFDQLKKLIKTLVNRLSATFIYLVSDHGFIYKRGNIVPAEKVANDKLDDSYHNRRFILTNQDQKIEGTLTFDMKYLLGNDCTLKCITPRELTDSRYRGLGRIMSMAVHHYRRSSSQWSASRMSVASRPRRLKR